MMHKVGRVTIQLYNFIKYFLLLLQLFLVTRCYHHSGRAQPTLLALTSEIQLGDDNGPGPGSHGTVMAASKCPMISISRVSVSRSKNHPCVLTKNNEAFVKIFWA